MKIEPCDEAVIQIEYYKKLVHAWMYQDEEVNRAMYLGTIYPDDVVWWTTIMKILPDFQVGVFSVEEKILKSSNELDAKITITGYKIRLTDLGPITEDFDIDKKEFYKIDPQPDSHQMAVKRIKLWEKTNQIT